MDNRARPNLDLAPAIALDERGTVASIGSDLTGGPPRLGRRADPLTSPDGATASLRLVIVSDAAGERNGVGTYYGDLVQHLRRHVACIQLIGPDRESVSSRWAWPMPGDPTQTIRMPRLGQLRRDLIALQPDVVIVPTPGPWGLFGAHFARQCGAKVVAALHTPFDQVISLYGRRLAIAAHALRAAHRHLFHRSTVVVVTSQTMIDAAHRLGAGTVRLIGTPLARAFLNDASAPVAPRVARVLVAGRLAPEKNIQAVVKAAAELPQLHFIIAGDGPMRASITAQADGLPNVELPGWMPRAAVLQLLDTIDLLVLPSHVESFGTVALEALARGRSVLASSTCGIMEWPKLAGTVFRIAAGEPLAQAIRRVVAVDSVGRRHMGSLGIQAAREMNRSAIQDWLCVLAAAGRHCGD